MRKNLTNPHEQQIERQNVFDKQKFLRDVKAIILIALFIFLLGTINLFSKTNEQILSTSAMEMSGYVGVYNNKYDEISGGASNADANGTSTEAGANSNTSENNASTSASNANTGENDANTQANTSSTNLLVKNTEQAAEQLKKIAFNLETDESALYDKQFFVLDKGRNEIIATGNVPEKVRDQLYSDVNEKLIIIDGQSCKVVDFDHYKMLVRVNTVADFSEFTNTISNYALVMLGILLGALVLTALGQLVPKKHEKLRLSVNIVLTLAIVCSLAFEVMNTELSHLDTIIESDKITLQTDIEQLCDDGSVIQSINKEGVEIIGNSMAKASVTLKEVKYIGDESKLASETVASGIGNGFASASGTATSSSSGSANSATADRSASSSTSAGDFSSANVSPRTQINAIRDIEITQDDNKIKNERTSFYIQAALLLILAFMLAKESRDQAVAVARAEKAGAAELTKNDKKIRTTLLLMGLASACFGIVSILRIRQVVMANWTDNVGAIISVIVTISMIVAIVGSTISSTLLKRCGSIKTFIISTCLLGVIGSAGCCISNNVVIFVVSLLIYNLAFTTSRMSDDFYNTLIDDPGRKDRCAIEFSAAKSIGVVVGTIAGGIVSEVVSLAFVQMLTSILFFITVLYAMRLNGASLKTQGNDETSIRKTLSYAGTAIKKPNLLMFTLCVVIVSSLPFMLIQYKLPLDIAALGFSAVVLSFLKTAQDIVEIYARPLYHVISRRLSPTTHAALYVSASGMVMVLYMLSGSSIVLIALSVAIMGLVSAGGQYAITKAFRDHQDLDKVPESDRIVLLRLTQKAGNTVTPPILSALQGSFVLPIVSIFVPIIFIVRDKFVGRGKGNGN